MYLYHYYDKMTGPFMNLSELSTDEANAVISEIKKKKPNVQCAQRDSEYMFRRHMYEDIIRKEFTKKGGVIKRNIPHYMVVEHSPWLNTWFENTACIRIPIKEFDLKTVSFTYGDSHPTFSPWPRDDDWKEYRRKLYTYDEILEVIKKYGLPQNWNNDGKLGPERYIEAHIWSNDTIDKYRVL
jgi:hypothetical protein